MEKIKISMQIVSMMFFNASMCANLLAIDMPKALVTHYLIEGLHVW